MKSAYELKREALDGLTGHWGIAIGAGLVASALISGASFSVSFPVDTESTSAAITGGVINLKILVVMLVLFAVALAVSLAISVAYSLFSSVIETGYARFNIDLVDYREPSFGSLFSYFRYWKNIAVAGVLKQLFITLGYMLFIVPGIIMYYNYAMVPYILADDPTISGKEALAKSKQMMYGHRWRLFCIGMSFFGWIILAMLSFGVGMIWLTPYMNATHAAFYKDLIAEQGLYTVSEEE